MDEIYCDLVEDACLGLSFEVHRAVKQGHFFLDDTDQESMKEFGWYQRFIFFILAYSKPLSVVVRVMSSGYTQKTNKVQCKKNNAPA